MGGSMTCTMYAVTPPKIVAVATDKYLTPTNSSVDKNLPGTAPKYGQDFTFGTGRAAPLGHNVGSTEAVLKPKMRKLLGEFASDDTTGMAKRLFDQFLAKQSTVYYFDDSDLNDAAKAHSNIKHFCDAALGSPKGKPPATGTIRIHQALEAAGWDINKLVAPTDLGVPAFNKGSKWRGTEDFGNGLGVMINGVQHVYVVATHYGYDASSNKYCIMLQFRFYDVFGLDDDDLKEFGEKSDGWTSTTAGVGITAWWQLQHQHGYAPLVTRIILNKTYMVSTV